MTIRAAQREGTRTDDHDTGDLASPISDRTTSPGSAPWPTPSTRAGDGLIAYEIAGTERLYPWVRERGTSRSSGSPSSPNRALETLPEATCSKAIRQALDRDRPDAVAIVGYSRPESTALLRWARRTGRPTILMSESQAIDHPRVWWKEAVKRTRVRRFSAALVGGPRHRDYLVDLGMPRERIALGYNAVDNDALRAPGRGRPPKLRRARRACPRPPYFLAVNRFAPEKNLVRLVRAFARYRAAAAGGAPGTWSSAATAPARLEVEEAVASSGFADAIHRPGFLQADELSRWYAFASAFVHPSLMEPWGLVVNEAAACGLPLLVSDRAGCVETLVPDLPETTGRASIRATSRRMSRCLAWMASLSVAERQAMGRRASEVVADWGPERFARGTLEAIELAVRALRRRRVVVP